MPYLPVWFRDGGEDLKEESIVLRTWFNESPDVLYLTPNKEVILSGWMETADEFYGRFTMSEIEAHIYDDTKIWVGTLMGARFTLDRNSDEELIKEYGLEYETKGKKKILKYENDRIRLRADKREPTLPYKLRPEGENKDKIALYLCSFLPFGKEGYDYKTNTMGLDAVLGMDITGELYAKSIITGMWIPLYYSLDIMESVSRFYNYGQSHTIFSDDWNLKIMEISAGNKKRAKDKSDDFYRYAYKKDKTNGIADLGAKKLIKTLCIWRTEDEQNGLMGELLSKKGRMPSDYVANDFDPSSQREYLVYDMPKQPNIAERNTHTLFLEYPWLYNPEKFFRDPEKTELNSLPMCAALTLLGEVSVIYEEYLPRDDGRVVGSRQRELLGGKGDEAVGVPVDIALVKENKSKVRKRYLDDVEKTIDEKKMEEDEDNARWSKLESTFSERVAKKKSEEASLKTRKPDLWREWNDEIFTSYGQPKEKREYWFDKKDFTWEKFEEIEGIKDFYDIISWMPDSDKKAKYDAPKLNKIDLYAVLYYYGAPRALAEWNAINRKVGPYIPAANDEEQYGWRGGTGESNKKINEARARANAAHSAYQKRYRERKDAIDEAMKPLGDATKKALKYYTDIQNIKDSERSERYKMEQEEKLRREFLQKEKEKKERDRAAKETESMGAEDVVIDKGGMKYEDFLAGFYDKRGRYRPQGLTKRGRPAKPPKEKENIKLTVKEVKPKAAPKAKATATATATKTPKSTKVQEKTEGAPSMADVRKVSDPDEVKRIANKLLGDKYSGDVPIEISTRKHQKYMLAIPGTRKKVHFGDIEREDFTKHKDEKRKDAFQKRNAKWKDAAWDTPAWLSYHLLW